jgi:hypothetical protein
MQLKKRMPLIELLKDVRDSHSNLGIHDISRYIRAAGYHTQVHLSKTNFFGEIQGVSITGSKDPKNLNFRSYDQENIPEVVVSIDKMSILGNHCEMNIICPPDQLLEDLELLVSHTIQKFFRNNPTSDPSEANH